MIHGKYIRRALTLAVVLSGVAFGAEQAKPLAAPWDKYQTLIRNNMFLRDRPTAARTNYVRPAPPPPERTTVLTGIVRQGDEYIAFLEDTRTRATNRVRVGDAACEGRMSEITLDYVEWLKGDAVKRIAVGQNLEGTAASSSFSLSSTVSAPVSEMPVSESPVVETPGVTPATVPPLTTSSTLAPAAEPDRAAVIERMRQRRLRGVK